MAADTKHFTITDAVTESDPPVSVCINRCGIHITQLINDGLHHNIDALFHTFIVHKTFTLFYIYIYKYICVCAQRPFTRSLSALFF